MSVRIDTDAQQAVPLSATDVDDPLSAFPHESKKPHEGSGAAWRRQTLAQPESSAT